MLIIAKIVAITIAIFVLAKITVDYKKKSENTVMFLFWECVWWGVIIVTLFPQLIDKIFGEGRSGVNTFLGLAFVFLLYLFYRVYLKADRTEKALNLLIKELAIHSSAKKHNQ